MQINNKKMFLFFLIIVLFDRKYLQEIFQLLFITRYLQILKETIKQDNQSFLLNNYKCCLCIQKGILVKKLFNH